MNAIRRVSTLGILSLLLAACGQPTSTGDSVNLGAASVDNFPAIRNGRYSVTVCGLRLNQDIILRKAAGRLFVGLQGIEVDPSGAFAEQVNASNTDTETIRGQVTITGTTLTLEYHYVTDVYDHGIGTLVFTQDEHGKGSLDLTGSTTPSACVRATKIVTCNGSEEASWDQNGQTHAHQEDVTLNRANDEIMISSKFWQAEVGADGTFSSAVPGGGWYNGTVGDGLIELDYGSDSSAGHHHVHVTGFYDSF